MSYDELVRTREEYDRLKSNDLARMREELERLKTNDQRRWEEYQQRTGMGWVCPRCGTVNSPESKICTCDPIRVDTRSTGIKEFEYTTKEAGMHQHIKG